MRRGAAPAGVLAAAAAAAVFVLGTSSAQTQDRPLRHDAAAVVKLVAVRVLDSSGHPVTDLGREDFKLFEDGLEKQITEFEAHAVTEAGMTVTPPRPRAAAAAAPAGGGLNRKLFFFFDLQAADTAGKAKAVNSALRFLETQAKPGDEAAVLGFYAMSGFFVREYLTTDMDRIRRAIKGAAEAPPSPGEIVAVGPDDTILPGEGETAAMDEKTAAAVAMDVPEFFLPQPVFVPGTAAFQRRDFAERMADLAEVFKTIPGTKSLVLFTSRNMGAAWERLGRQFGETGTAVYAVNTQDWKMSFFGTKVHHIWWEHSLKSLAEASGGMYLADINDYEGNVREIQDLTGHFYVLGYYVKESWEGKYHKIRVETSRPGARVLVQDGYADPIPFADMTDFEKEIQLVDLIWSDEPASRPLAVPVDALVVTAGGAPSVCLLTEFSVGAKADAPAGKVEVFALLRSEGGTAILSRKWNLDLSRYDGRFLCPYLISSVPSGEYEFRMVLRDHQTGDSLIGRTRFDVAAMPADGIRLSSPLLFEGGPEASFLKLAEPSGRAEKTYGPALIDLYRLIPRGVRPVIGEVRTGQVRLTAVLPFEIRPAPLAEEPPLLAVEAKLISGKDGLETPVEIVVRDHKLSEGRPEILVAEVALPDVAPGSYDLVFGVEDVGTGRRATARKALTVR